VYNTDWRGVEGSVGWCVLRKRRKAFSREFPDTASIPETFSGSFDSPSSRAAGLGLVRMTQGKSVTKTTGIATPIGLFALTRPLLTTWAQSRNRSARLLLVKRRSSPSAKAF